MDHDGRSAAMPVTAQILEEIADVLTKLDGEHVVNLARVIHRSPRIFVVGEGRSGLMARAFAMRLMHLGATVYVVGETITPAVGAGDLLIGVSGSGMTESTVRIVSQAKEHGVQTYAISANPASSLATVAHQYLEIAAATRHRRDGEHQTIQPLGSLFDQCLHVTLDAVCLVYAGLQQEDNASASGRHSNLE